MGIENIGNLLRTQDGRCTAHPQYIVQLEEIIYGIDEEYADDFAWLDECGEPEDEEHWPLFEDAYDDNIPHVHIEGEGYILDHLQRVGIKRIWTFVQPFFTEAAAIEFIANNAHRYNKMRIDVDSGHRNREWQEIRSHFMQA